MSRHKLTSNETVSILCLFVALVFYALGDGRMAAISAAVGALSALAATLEARSE